MPKKPTKKVAKPQIETVRQRTDKGLTAGRTAEAKQAKTNQVFKPIKVVFSPLSWILGKITPRYFKNSWAELKQVTWPSGKESRQLTIAVVAFAIVLGGIITVVDYGLDNLFKKVILKQ